MSHLMCVKKARARNKKKKYRRWCRSYRHGSQALAVFPYGQHVTVSYHMRLATNGSHVKVSNECQGKCGELLDNTSLLPYSARHLQQTRLSDASSCQLNELLTCKHITTHCGSTGRAQEWIGSSLLRTPISL